MWDLHKMHYYVALEKNKVERKKTSKQAGLYSLSWNSPKDILSKNSTIQKKVLTLCQESEVRKRGGRLWLYIHTAVYA